MSNTLILKSKNCGCTPDQEPWKPAGRDVKIKNETDSDQFLSNISNGLLVPAPSGIIALRSGEEWSGRVGTSRGTYNYDDGTGNISKVILGVKTGTIDPG